MNNKLVILASAILVLVAGGLILVQQQSAAPRVLVYKTPTCGCCTKWVDHMRQAGFEVETRDLNDLYNIKAEYGVKREFSSCHTALVDGYVVEGHVPATYVQQLLDEKPEVVGIAVPGMPIGSPGMEGPQPVAYDVVAFNQAGQTAVFARVTPN